MGGKLGIFVSTNRHPDYVRKLARAAAELDKQVHVHFSGDGLELAAHPLLTDLNRFARVTRSTDADGQSIDLPVAFRSCDRCVVF